jgi:hypothetical protein
MEPLLVNSSIFSSSFDRMPIISKPRSRENEQLIEACTIVKVACCLSKRTQGSGKKSTMLLVEHWEVHLLNKYRNHNWEKGIEQISKTLTVLFLHKAAETLTKSN